MIVLECGMMVFGMSDFSCDFLPNVAALCVLFDAPVVQFQDRRFAPNFLLEPCLAVAQALSRTPLRSVLLFGRRVRFRTRPEVR